MCIITQQLLSVSFMHEPEIYVSFLLREVWLHLSAPSSAETDDSGVTVFSKGVRGADWPWLKSAVTHLLNCIFLPLYQMHLRLCSLNYQKDDHTFFHSEPLTSEQALGSTCWLCSVWVFVVEWKLFQKNVFNHSSHFKVDSWKQLHFSCSSSVRALKDSLCPCLSFPK